MALLARSNAARRLSGPRGTVLLALGLWLLLLSVNPGRKETIDVSARLAVTRQLWTTGAVVIQARPPGTESLWIEVAPGRYAAPYGVGQSLVFVPFDIVGGVLESHAPVAWRGYVSWLPIGLGLLPLLGLLYWFALRLLLQEWGLAAPWPNLGALAMMLGTTMFFYAGQAQEETLVGLCLTLALTFTLRLRRWPDWKNATVAGLFAGACLTIRPIGVFALSAAPVLILGLKESWVSRLRLLAVAGLATATVGLIALWHNFARFGEVLTFGYDRMGHLSKLAFDMRWPQTLVTLQFGLGGGLLVLSPLLLVAIPGMRHLWKSDRAYFAAVLVAFASCYSFFSAWHDSHTGGTAWGSRYQVHLLALLLVPVTLGLQRLVETPRRRALALAVLALSLGIQGLSVFATHHLEPFQASCDGMTEDNLLDSPSRGQLARRAVNLTRWAVGAPPPALKNPECQPAMSKMWDRYIPNFWGPVYAYRIARGGTWIRLLWSTLLGMAFMTLAVGLRRELKSLRRPQSQEAIAMRVQE